MTEKKKDAKNIIVMCEDCNAWMAARNDEVQPTCYICGGKMLEAKDDQGVGG